MNKHISIVIVTLSFLAIGFSGCIDIFAVDGDNSELDRFIGTWQANYELTLSLFSNGTCVFIGGYGTWEVKDEKLFITIRFKDGQNMMSYDYQFSDNDKTLTLIDAGDRTTVYAKK